MNKFILNHETKPKRKNFQLHHHASYEMFIMMSGKTTVLVDDKLISLNERDIMLLRPDILHKNAGEKIHDRYSIHFTREYLTEYFSDKLIDSITGIFKNNKLTVTDSAFNDIIKLIYKIEENQDYACIHTAEIAAVLSDKNNLISSDIRKVSKTSDSILEYIKKNYSVISGLDDIARDLYISKPYMCHIFKKETDITISDYLNSIRISNACELLKDGEKNITETATQCGYNSAAYFCRMFKKIMKVTPKEYQKIRNEQI